MPQCPEITPGRAPLRRLTRFEYNNTVEALLADDTRPGNSLPAEVLGNGFGNDADQQPYSDFLVEQYSTVAENVAQSAFADPTRLALLAPCALEVTEAEESNCARTFIEAFAPRAYRRPLQSGEADELLSLQQLLRANSSFEQSLAGVVEAVLQSPDFLYKIERGTPDPADPTLRMPSGHEMATRLSYLFWGTQPDAELEAAAKSGELVSAEGVATQASRLLEDARARPVLRFFFDHFLPLDTLTDLARAPEQYPTFSPKIGQLMREETQRFLEYEIFEGPGDWPSVLTAPYTFVNEELAGFYGIAGVSGDEFRKVDIDTSKRLGLLTQGAIQTGTTISNFTNPVRRGVFILRNMLCMELPDPPESFADKVMPLDPYSGDTARERYTQHSAQLECAGCHAVMDPPGFGFENYDAVGLWRDQENDVTIDASGTLLPLNASFTGPVELVRAIADSELTQNCFANTWANFAYGRKLDAEDSCTTTRLQQAFGEAGYDVRQLLLALTQTDAFLYLPSEEQL